MKSAPLCNFSATFSGAWPVNHNVTNRCSLWRLQIKLQHARAPPVRQSVYQREKLPSSCCCFGSGFTHSHKLTLFNGDNRNLRKVLPVYLSGYFFCGYRPMGKLFSVPMSFKCHSHKCLFYVFLMSAEKNQLARRLVVTHKEFDILSQQHHIPPSFHQ